MSDIEINGHVYRIGKLPTRTQLLVVKRLMPVMQGLLPLFGPSNQRLTTDEDGNTVPDLSRVNVFEALAALSNTVNLMSDADALFLYDTALDVVRWQQGNTWHPLRAGPGGAYLLGDADSLDVQLRLLFEVLKESLGSFSLATLLTSQTGNGLDQSPSTLGAPRATAQ